MYAITQSDK